MLLQEFEYIPLAQLFSPKIDSLAPPQCLYLYFGKYSGFEGWDG